MEEVEVFRGGGGSSRAQFLEASLREAGITALIKTSGGVVAHPFTVGPMAEFSILVAPENEERAQQVLRSVTEETFEGSEDLHDDDEPQRKLALDRTKTPAQRRGLRLGVVPVVALALYLFYRGSAPEISLGVALIFGALLLYSGSRVP